MAGTTAVYIGIFIASIVLISAGVTGFSVVSQSCCFGSECPQEQLCDPDISTNAEFAVTGLGIFLMLMSLAGLHKHFEGQGMI